MKSNSSYKTFLMPRFLLSAMVMLSLSVFSALASAAQPDAAQSGGRDFNHMSTGFPLVGLHASAECGSCHVGGVFKGTPRNCSGCHAKGKRVVATAMSSKHLITTEACDVCHTNAVTFYGARYNHGKAVAGQCTSCHNGLIATGRVASHSTGNKATKSCDSCHRTTAWLPSSWNHYSVTAKCVTCHVAGGEGSTYVRTMVAGTSAVAFAHRYTSISDCESCHTKYTTWSGALYDHAGAGASTSCSSCHNGTNATGIAQKSGHVAIGSSECGECHTSKTTWLGALGGKPSNHIDYNASATCSSCHVGSTTISGASLHGYVNSLACTACHLTGATKSLGVSGKKSVGHEGMGAADDCSKSGCHKPLGNKGTAYTNWD